MNFGERVRALRLAKNLTQRELSAHVDVGFTYISKIENGKLHFGDFPSEKFINKLAIVLDADEDELLLLADKVPERIRKRIRERPEVFRIIAGMDDKTMDRLVRTITMKK